MKKIIIFALLIAVVFLINGCTDAVLGPVGGGGTPSSMSKQNWKMVAPIAIVDYSYSGNTLDISVMNNSAYTVTIDSFEIRDLDYVSTITDNITLTAGQRKIVSIAMGSPCLSGTEFSISKDKISIVYSSQGETNISQEKVFDLVGKCQ
ncbi:MAG: hypothetical protein HOE11_02940 [Candidatus Diapherotrites archaeon]|jgi:hypothetical protein|nr:hypothetical protein [Candidatus Diapherotrites archaeon]MBT4597017.1 hypothetical protein [Candidatus Diapherotrites archaeon]